MQSFLADEDFFRANGCVTGDSLRSDLLSFDADEIPQPAPSSEGDELLTAGPVFS